MARFSAISWRSLSRVTIGVFIVLFPVVSMAQESIYGYENPELNHVLDGGFEDWNIESGRFWTIFNANVDVVNGDCHHGNMCVFISNRTNEFGGVQQKLYNIKPGKMYYMSIFVKAPYSATDSMYYTVSLILRIQTKAGFLEDVTVARLPNLEGSKRWRQLGGDFIAPEEDIDWVLPMIEVKDLSIDYILDSVSIIEIPEDPEWQNKANAEIREHRMGDVQLISKLPPCIAPCHVKIRINQTRPDYRFGAVVQVDRFIEQTAFGDTLRSFLPKHFTWSGFQNAMKWKPMELIEGEPRLERVDKALDIMEAHNISTRAHSILWGRAKNCPKFVRNRTGYALNETVNRRIDYLLNHFKGRFEEWDVINEWLHGTFFEENIGERYFQDRVFQMSKAIDPKARFLINDYDCLKLGSLTSAIVDLAHELKLRGVPIEGIGIESHLRYRVRPEILRKRLAILRASGFPLSITEMSIHQTDPEIRAQQLEEALTLYYSTPEIGSIMFWTYSDQEKMSFVSHETLLWGGEHLQPSLAGQRYEDLRQNWTTHREIEATNTDISEKFRAFYGAYDIQVYYKDALVCNHSVYASPGVETKWFVSCSDDEFSKVMIDEECSSFDQGSLAERITSKPKSEEEKFEPEQKPDSVFQPILHSLARLKSKGLTHSAETLEDSGIADVEIKQQRRIRHLWRKWRKRRRQHKANKRKKVDPDRIYIHVNPHEILRDVFKLGT